MLLKVTADLQNRVYKLDTETCGFIELGLVVGEAVETKDLPDLIEDVGVHWHILNIYLEPVNQ
jgi:hypothetical protein